MYNVRKEEEKVHHQHTSRAEHTHTYTKKKNKTKKDCLKQNKNFIIITIHY